MPQTKKIKCLVVDDEPPAREILKQHIAGVDALELAGTCANAVEAISFLKNHPVDIIFLDIQMPQLLGTNFIRTLKAPPKVIFTTAFRKYALEGFELDAVDYLLKPVQKEDLQMALDKYRQMKKLYAADKETSSVSIDALIKELQQKLQTKEHRKRFLVKHGQKLVSVDADEIAYFFSDGRLNFFKTFDNIKFVVNYTMD